MSFATYVVGELDGACQFTALRHVLGNTTEEYTVFQCIDQFLLSCGQSAGLNMVRKIENLVHAATGEGWKGAGKTQGQNGTRTDVTVSATINQPG